jgi:hypothetical protein
MKKTKIQKLMLVAFVMLLVSVSGYSQLFKPVVTDIGSSLKKQKFVLVVKANEKFNKPERVVMNDWKASEEAFDPEKIDQYPQWSFQNFMILNNDGTQKRHLILKNETTGMYFSYPSGVKMRTKKEFDEYFARNEQNKYKKSLKEQYQFLFIPQVEGNYMRLGIPNDEGKSLAVTPMDWNTRYFKLVLVK